MEAVRILVNKQMDGYSFGLLPSARDQIRSLIPDAHPANGIFVAYDIKSGFEKLIDRLENYIYPALFGVKNQADLSEKVDEILFVDTQTGDVISTLYP
jgi:hypothetical protein